jgi:hypothetical protein
MLDTFKTPFLVMFDGRTSRDAFRVGQIDSWWMHGVSVLHRSRCDTKTEELF